MTNQQPIIPPPELVKQWSSNFYGTTVAPGEAAIDIATQAARWGADQELKACIEWIAGQDWTWTKAQLREARRPNPVAPTDEELLKLMPETMLDEFSYAAKVCSDATGGQVKPGIFRVSLNTGALDYARAVLARWGLPQYQPIPEATNA